MTEVFEAYLNSKADFCATDMAYIMEHVQFIYLKKGENLYNEGAMWPYDGIVCSGLLCKHTIDLDGEQKVMAFCSEHYWVGDRSSSLTGKPVAFTATALEDTTIACLNIDEFDRLRIEIPLLNEMCQQLIHNNMEAAQKRIANNMIQSDEERYCDFINARPGVAERISPELLSSYLGIGNLSL
ncbi:MAG: Crp/Fnr family transcriptional regulator, partial [Flavobacterium sp.]